MIRVVVCEDDILQAIDLIDVIERNGAVVCGAFTRGDEAQRASQLLRPQAAFIDLTLQDGETGVATAISLSQRGCKVFILSGAKAVNRALSSIEHVFVAKPIDMEIISQLLGPLKSLAPASSS